MITQRAYVPEIPNFLTYPAEQRSWREQALCRGMDVNDFFKSGLGANRAKAVCGQCPVAVECGSYADETDSVGVWAGTFRNAM